MSRSFWTEKHEKGDSEDHQTSTTSLTLIVVFVCFVVISALGVASPEGQTENTDKTTKKQSRNISHPKLTSDHLDGFPDGLPVINADVVGHNSKKTGQGRQQILQLKTKDDFAGLVSGFNRWAQASNYEVIQKRENNDNATIITGNTGARFFIRLSERPDMRRVELNHVEI
jgi:hypothetical protein